MNYLVDIFGDIVDSIRDTNTISNVSVSSGYSTITTPDIKGLAVNDWVTFDTGETWQITTASVGSFVVKGG